MLARIRLAGHRRLDWTASRCRWLRHRSRGGVLDAWPPHVIASSMSESSWRGRNRARVSPLASDTFVRPARWLPMAASVRCTSAGKTTVGMPELRVPLRRPCTVRDARRERSDMGVNRAAEGTFATHHSRCGPCTGSASGLIRLHQVAHKQVSTAVVAHQHPRKLLGVDNREGQLRSPLDQAAFEECVEHGNRVPP